MPILDHVKPLGRVALEFLDSEEPDVRVCVVVAVSSSLLTLGDEDVLGKSYDIDVGKAKLDRTDPWPQYLAEYGTSRVRIGVLP